MTNYDYVELPKPKESGFDLSQSNKLTMDFGDMVPVFKQEVLPGDEFKVKAQFMVRLAPLANPIFTKINAQIHYFFVPNRLLWQESKSNSWETFITGGKDGTATPIPPYMDLDDLYFAIKENEGDAGRGAQTLADYMGVPLMPTDYVESDFRGLYKINALPFLAYQKIYDDWFRDPNITNSLFDLYEDEWLAGSKIGDTDTKFPELAQLLQLRKRCWSKDYFTSALPWAQRGEEVHIPVGQKFNVVCSYRGDNPVANGSTEALLLGANANSTSVVVQSKATAADGIQLNPLSLGTIRDLRNASALQLWLEKNAVGGARYIEQLLAHFGVYSPDARLQRAEYLGSVKSPVVISEIQSNASTEDEPLGKLGGKGISYGNDFAFNEKFTEHGWIIGIMTVMPEASYAQGLHRSLTHRNEKLDYAFPEFAELGLQEIDNSEIFVTDTPLSKDIFGYNDRYAEYKSNYNEVHGLFRDEKQTLAQYNMTRFYASTPELGSKFLEVREEDITSPFVDTAKNSGNIWVDLWSDVKAIRPLPKNSLPLF